MGLTTRATIFLIVSAFLASFLGACTSTPEKPVPPVETPTFPLTVTDQQGRAVKLEKVPERIISLAPTNTEIVFALGLEDRLVGVTTYCDYPEGAKDKPKVGGFTTVDIEKVVEIQPDLILATRVHEAELIPELERLGLTVLNLYPKTLDEVLEAITLVGKCTGKEDVASQLVTDMRNRVTAITDKTANLTEAQRPRVFYAVRHDPLWTVGADHRIHELIVLAGGINIAQDLSGSTTISMEAVIQANPQVIIANLGPAHSGPALGVFLRTEERLGDVDARINNRIYEIDTGLIGRAGPRIVDALELLAKMIHPEIFGTIG